MLSPSNLGNEYLGVLVLDGFLCSLSLGSSPSLVLRTEKWYFEHKRLKRHLQSNRHQWKTGWGKTEQKDYEENTRMMRKESSRAGPSLDFLSHQFTAPAMPLIPLTLRASLVKRTNAFSLRLKKEKVGQGSWWQGKMVYPLWKTVWQFLKKLYGPAVPQELRYLYPCFHSNIIHNS